MKQFKYNDPVRVVSGFYAGQRGQVKGAFGFWIFKHYLVSGDPVFVEFVKARDLELVKE